jgi:peptidoglycan hydrolase-like protein with peptidoglycan-binding domain
MSMSRTTTRATSSVGAHETPADSDQTPSSRAVEDIGINAVGPDPNRPDNRFRAMPLVSRGSRDGSAARDLDIDPTRPVRTLQTWLNRCTNAGLLGDGDFGPATDAAVRRFQRFWKLTDDGVVGRITWSQLDIALDLQGK